MSRYISLIITMLCILQGQISANQPITFRGSESATVGVLIKDLKTGRSLADYNSGKLLAPASTMKLVTVASAMQMYRPEERYQTNIELRGNINSSDGVFSGEIVILPSGDPTVNSNEFNSKYDLVSYIVDKLKENGVKAFHGEVIVKGYDIPQQGQLLTWEIEDASYAYGAGWFAFNFNDNIIRYNIADGETVPPAPFLNITHQPSDNPFEITHGIDSEQYTLSGRIPVRGTVIKLPVPWPATLFFEQLLTALENNGISYMEDSFDDSGNLPLLSTYQWYSPQRGDIYRHLMKHSDNTMAEATLRSLAPGISRDSALIAEEELLRNINVSTKGMRIFDGSGLTRKNALTPLFLISVLENMAKTDMAKEYASYFPVAGDTGTMKSFSFHSKRGMRLALKTGSVNGVRCYAGYLLDKKGTPVIAIAIMTNNIICSSSDVRTATEKFLDKILNQYK